MTNMQFPLLPGSIFMGLIFQRNSSISGVSVIIVDFSELMISTIGVIISDDLLITISLLIVVLLDTYSFTVLFIFFLWLFWKNVVSHMFYWDMRLLVSDPLCVYGVWSLRIFHLRFVAVEISSICNNEFVISPTISFVNKLLDLLSRNRWL